jgi:peptidylprolyl isomerase
MMMAKLRSLLPLALVAAALLAASCGDDDSDNAGDGTTEQQTQATQPPAQAPAAAEPKAKKVKPAAAEANLSRKPRPAKGQGDPPSSLVVEDLVVGKGRKAAVGDAVSVQYVGVLFDTGKEFDASWKGGRPGQPFQFSLGGGQVIPGWDQGVVGMKKGGRRELVIPPDLAYGPQGSPPAIGPNETLVFVIDLKKIA